jgi:hypothetical protein
MIFYLSGPMSDMPDLNFPAFNEATGRLRMLGLQVVNPAELGEAPGWKWRDYLKRDLSLLMLCDGIIMLPGWEKSKGARLEHHNAVELDFCVATLEEVCANPQFYREAMAA